MGKTYHLSEKELLDLGFSKVAARALRYVFDSIGDGQTPDLTLVELNELVKDLAYTPSASTAVNSLAEKVSELAAIQMVNQSSRLIDLEKKIKSLEENMLNTGSYSKIAMLEKKISDLEKQFVST